MMATYKIANRDSTATCFVISHIVDSQDGQQDLLLITAAHVLEKMSGDECRIVVRAKQDDSSFERMEIPLKVRSNNQPLWVRHPRMDVAALKMELPTGHPIVGLDFEQLSKESDLPEIGFQPSGEVWIPGFPAQLESSQSGFPVLRRGTLASFPLTPIKSNETFILNSDTFGGDSGAPVLMRSRQSNDQAEKLSIVGLVIGQHRETTKTVSPLEERVFHRPISLAIAVHSDFIRQTVELIKP
jgi:hypothetical protein